MADISPSKAILELRGLFRAVRTILWLEEEKLRVQEEVLGVHPEGGLPVELTGK